uniref:Uncharacterized protein n=1 Tax=virus sp. ctusH3 TaxID=2825826 RepID=A0A8S5RMJ0_9VIRU|nr:MAG TPA: hypothetical protein [virus sp. ctusH3]
MRGCGRCTNPCINRRATPKADGQHRTSFEFCGHTRLLLHRCFFCRAGK